MASREIALLIFDPATPGTLLPGSYGGRAVATTPATIFDVTLSPEAAGVIGVADIGLLTIVPTIHELFTGLTISPFAGGFTIDFGVALVRVVSIAVSRAAGG